MTYWKNFCYFQEFPAEKVTENPEEKVAEYPPEASVNPKTPSINEETAKSSKNGGKSEKEQSDEGSNSQEKILKKPDEVLPCPRCNSMDTKFCYYNNYNINQPRYFCKSCQRYWTAGGTIRNVPVGAGRRKSKNTSSHYRHITISEALQAARIDSPCNTTNGKVLSFGLDAYVPICDSMASALNLAGNNVVAKGSPNGFHSFEDQGISIPSKIESSMELESGKSSHLQIPCLPAVPWAYPPAFPPLSFYHPAAFWNYAVSCNWNIVPWFSSNSFSPTLKSPISGPNSPTLGKHSRDGDRLRAEYLQKEEPSKQRNAFVLVPKTLRIDDPSEAAKSSIWATLGIKKEELSVSGGVMFEAFQSKKEEKKQNHGMETSSVLNANPAAMCRSLNFHENS